MKLLPLRPVLIGLVTVTVLAVSSACGGSSQTRYDRVFQSPPWTGPESYQYNLLDQGGHLYGTCTLETKPNSEPGRTQLNRLCGNGPNHDDGSVTADANTLEPMLSSRTISDDSKNRKTVYTATYEYPSVKLHSDDNGKTHDTVRALPQADSTSPNPGYYDDDSLLWLVRGIPLTKGFSGTYRNILSGNAQVTDVTVTVEKQERIQLPAGDFDTWNVRIDSGSVTQHIWVESAAPHRMVQASLESLTYQLAGPG